MITLEIQFLEIMGTFLRFAIWSQWDLHIAKPKQKHAMPKTKIIEKKPIKTCVIQTWVFLVKHIFENVLVIRFPQSNGEQKAMIVGGFAKRTYFYNFITFIIL